MKIKILPKARKSLQKLPKTAGDKVVFAIERLAKNFPNGENIAKLTAQPGYRIRVGDYRVLFIADSKLKVLYIVRIAHRKDAYR